MHRFFHAVVKPLLEAVRPKVIVEVGSSEGRHTELLLDYAIKLGAVVHVVDPHPKFDDRRFEERYGASYRAHPDLSLSALGRIEAPDVVLIDGDHNWYTVVNELRLLDRRAREASAPFPVTLLHDVDWPYGRRDLYYAPETIPEGQRQPYRQAGVKPGSSELLADDGLNPHLHHALHENDLRNGVRTAVEDFTAETDTELQFISVPGIYGLGILLPTTALEESKKLRALSKRVRSSEFLQEQVERVEVERIEALIEQERAKRRMRRAHADLEELSERATALGGEVDGLRAETEHARVAEREAAERLTGALAELEGMRAREGDQEETAGLRARLEEAEGLRSQLEDSLRDQGAKASRRRAELEEAVEERRRIEAELAEGGERLQAALREVADAGSERERLRADVATRDHQLEAARLVLAEAKAELEHARRERQQARDEADAALESARGLSRELVDREVAHARAVQQADALRHQATADLADAEAKLREARTEADARRRANADLRQELDRTAAGARASDAAVARAREELEDAVARHQQLEREAADAAEDGARRAAEGDAALAEQRAELVQAAQLRVALEAQLADRVGELEQAVERRDALEAELSSQNSRASALQADLENAVALRRKVQSELTVRSEAADATQSELERAVALRRRVQADLRAAEREADSLRDAIWSRERRIEELLGELREFRDDVERAADSRSWRYGHGFMRFLSRITFRSTKSEGALERLVRRLDDLPAGDLPGLPPSRHDDAAVEPTVEPAVEPAIEPELAATPPDLTTPWVDPEDTPTGPPAAADLPGDRSVRAEELMPENSERERAIAEFRAEANQAAAESLAANLGRTRATLTSFHERLGPDWLSGARGRNERFFEDLTARRRTTPPRVMVGTLESGEVELETCKRAIARQAYGQVEHVVIGGLPKKAAVAALMERFLESDFDVLVKVDGDVVLLDDNFVERAVGVLRANEGVDMLQMAILDYFSGGPMQGVNAYRRGLDWQTERQDPLFTDRTSIPKERRLVAWAPFVRSAIHSPDPSAFQAFHFGVHRGMKVLQPGNGSFNADQAAEQTMYLERTWEHFLVRRDPRLGLACLGYELATAGEFELADLDYTSVVLRERFDEYEGLDAGRVRSEVEGRRTSPSRSQQVEPVRRERRRILWRSTADVESILMVLPHFGVFGGVNRFFELARCLGDLGVECVLARPQDDALFHGKRKLVVDRPDYPEVRTITFDEALARSWDVVLCGDCTSGVMMTLPLFQARLSAAYLLNGWMHREANARQLRLTAPDVVIANSSYAARFFEDFAPVVVPGGINRAVFKPPAGERARQNGGPRGNLFKVMAYAGRSKPAKRFEDVVEACTALDEAGVPVELNVYDQSSMELDAPFAWRFHGGLLRHQVRDLMWEMDAFLSAERDAGWSNPTAEAMACGVPLVCTEAGTVDFAVDGETALVVPTGRPDLLTEAAQRLWNDPALARSLSSAGLERIAGFGWPSVARELLDLFRDARRDGSRRRLLNEKASAAVEELVAGVSG